MPFKPNYRMQRADRERAKEQRKQAKMQRRAEKAATQETISADAPESHSTDGDTTESSS
ncbi:MAG TPA: hypothetical protein VN766_19450 [Stellaceae bacterium]|jgi:hypothetical protein|nr:hypothetical protein [Stellaceae bacterium]